MTLRRLQVLLPLVLVLAGVGVWAGLHPATVGGGADAMTQAETPWLVPAALFAFLVWVSSAVLLQGAVAEDLPRGKLLAVAVASAAVGHIGPGTTFCTAVQARFVQKETGSVGAAAGALALRATAGLLVRVTMVLALVSAGVLSAQAFHLSLVLPITVGGVVVALLVPKTRRLLRGSWSSVVEVGRRPLRLVQLLSGSAGQTLLHGLSLLCVARAFDATASYGAVLAAYVAASAAAAAVPTPGGVGPLEAALVAALVASGTDTPTALAIVITYRVISVWLPLVPGLWLLGSLRRRSVV